MPHPITLAEALSGQVDEAELKRLLHLRDLTVDGDYVSSPLVQVFPGQEVRFFNRGGYKLVTIVVGQRRSTGDDDPVAA